MDVRSVEKMDNFRKLWLYVTFYKTGDWIRIIAIPLAIYNKTGSAFYMASAYGVSFLPWMLSIFGGLVSDRFPRRNILKISSLLSSIMMTAIALLIISDEFNIHLLMVLLFFLSLIEPFSHPAEQSIIPLIVEKKSLFSANSSIQLVNNTLSTIGPVLGGAIIAFLGVKNSLFISCFLYLLSFIPIFKMNLSESIDLTKKINILTDIKDGLRITYKTKFVLYGSFLFFFTNFAIHLFQANLVFFIVDFLGYSTLEVSIVLSISGIGAIFGAFFARHLNEKSRSPNIIISSSTFLAGITTYLMYYASNYIIIGIILGITYFLGSINVVTYFSSRQKLVPQEFLGRVVSVTRLISFLSIPIGSVLGGWLITNSSYSIGLIIVLSATVRTFAGVFSFLFLKFK
ncbi:hypothetical protein B0188_09560 [[Haemophilus] felis]|uniref:Major facilitator superfamily (MFS) profile domain-containing protein n=1 Tax=[Haemophilus] felis TaxID=123822 RepID=A0A1T0AWL0_9PAST|nr:hypothetical protein B0188_09560 [[Haemophilus] felis]